MTKTVVKKTFKVQALLDQLNWNLANDHQPSNSGRGPMMLLVEDVLHKTGNYRGFRYLEQHEVPVGCKPGIQPKSTVGLDADATYRFLNTDPTRVRYS